MHDYWSYGSGNDMWGLFYMFFMLIFVVIGGLITFWYLRRDIGSVRQPDNALDLLKKRYAKGEIDKKEFEEKRKDLSK